jgi:glycosyltransferase 2 family protein
MMQRIKTGLRWALIAAVVFFLGRSLWQNWQTVAAVRIAPIGWAVLGVGLLCSLVAHCWAGANWAVILRLLQPRDVSQAQAASIFWGVRVYLTTNLAKYLPGNVWHFYGRFNACRDRQIPAGQALLSILLEPLLMAAAGVIVVVGCLPWRSAALDWRLLLPQVVGLGAVLVGIHPQVLNQVLRKVGGAKRRRLNLESIPQLKMYPLTPLLGEVGFVLLRATGFVVVWSVVQPIGWVQVPQLYSSFAIAWLLGLIVPGLPGGIGLFEAVMLGLMGNQGTVLVIVALYRVVNTIAEVIGAAIVQIGQPRLLFRAGDD